MRILAGRALAHAGQRDRAIAELDRAASDLLACRALGRRDQAASEIARLVDRRSRTRRRSSSPGMEALSERERAVAELVGQGRTNREIAGELFLRLKTIERHVSHIFDKLGVSTRAAVAGIVGSASPSAVQSAEEVPLKANGAE